MPMKIKIRLVREPSYVLKQLDKAAEIALFYGFQPVKTPRIEKVDIDQANSILPDKIENMKKAFPRAEEKASFLRTFLEWNLHEDPLPVMVQYRRAVGDLGIKRQPDEYNYTLDIVGAAGSVAEAIAIRTATAILADHGHNKIIVDINSIGDKDSTNQFIKELTNFSRKRGSNMPPEVRQQLRKDPFEVWQCDHEKWREVRDHAPQSLNFLSEQSGEHFRQVLEYLENFEIPYRINHSLVGIRHYCSHTIFEIKNQPETGENSEEKTFAIGTRHNYLTRRIGFKKDVPVVSVNLHFKKASAIPKLFFKNKPQPKFFFIQFGSIAKLKSLPVIESLRQAKIPVHHLLTSDKFLGQMTSAEKMKTPFVIIMGQKEALENTVVVRHMPTRSQKIISLPDLSQYLSKLG